MLKLDDIKKNNELLNAIDWDMTPEEAEPLLKPPWQLFPSFFG